MSTIVLNISALLVAKIGIKYCDFRFQRKKKYSYFDCLHYNLQYPLYFVLFQAAGEGGGSLFLTQGAFFIKREV